MKAAALLFTTVAVVDAALLDGDSAPKIATLSVPTDNTYNGGDPRHVFALRLVNPEGGAKLHDESVETPCCVIWA